MPQSSDTGCDCYGAVCPFCNASSSLTTDVLHYVDMTTGGYDIIN